MALTLCALPLLSACDHDQDIAAFELEAFEDGVSKDTEGGAFRVTLEGRDGLVVGDNTLIVHVGFLDPSDPDGPGVGVPGAQVTLDAYMPAGPGHRSGLEATYLEDGRYVIEGLEFDEAGAWRLELAIEVGATIDESVAFAFDVR